MSKISFKKELAKDPMPQREENLDFTESEISHMNGQTSDITSNLDVNLIIVSFQEKISQLITEIVVKDATIRQQANLINKLKGNK
jgi:hypothetical protein